MFVFLLLLSPCFGWDLKHTLDIQKNKLDEFGLDKLVSKHRHDFYEIDGNSPQSEQLKSYIQFVSKLSENLINNVHGNIKRNYELNADEVKTLDYRFNTTNLEYESILNEYLNKMAKGAKYNDSTIFLLDFMDLSNFLLQSVIESNLADIKGKFLLPNSWYNQPLKYTMLRQQMKIVMNVMEITICRNLSICIDNAAYTEYIIEWLRLLLNADDETLLNFFKAISEILTEKKHTIKSNIIFRSKCKTAANSHSSQQRNILDFLDEVLSGQDTDIFQSRYKQVADMLKGLFKIIDDNYELNYENTLKLDDVSLKFFHLKDISEEDIKYALDTIVENMQVNIKIWPLNVQNELEYAWEQITLQ
ncbi:uncharacterized protein LOC123705569 [Colias croceus]|uniref:uncharacterized protein LOC123705569 n=1 Tax=Colias crocea TaxID=72248 RepID=UPI001E28021F|nr:uncharacterized protein LOC123705569 [Colias croceus]